MKKNKTHLKLICTVFTVCTAMSTAAQASEDGGLFIEPAITYETGDSTVNWPSPFSNSTGKVEGFGLGARLGFHINKAFFLGFDGRYSMPNFKDSSVNYDAKATAANWGPVVGVQMPDMGLRIWGTYVMGGELNPEKSGNFDVKVKDPTGYRAGVGFHVASVSLNLEYQQLKYDTSILEQVGSYSANTSFSNVTLENKSWIASVSFPVEL